MKLVIVVGTRPEVIKMSPVIRECQKRQLPFVLIHSNQHYSSSMDEIFFQELGLPRPDYNLNVGSGKHSNQTGNILIKIEPILEKEQPDIVLVQGDTNTVMAAALAASKLGIKIGHVEAGLRSYDRTMPEESNRVITDHLSDFLFAVSETQQQILLQEGILKRKINVVGNTVADALLGNLVQAKQKSNILKKVNLINGEYILFTAHRSANVDYPEALAEIIQILKTLEVETRQKIIWPIHPRTKNKLGEYKLELPVNVIAMDPVGYLDFLALEANASLIVTDSGGVQEEACILKIPCITVRENTERPETVEVGSNIIIGRNPEKLKQALSYFEQKEKKWQSPFGDGKSAEHILDVIEDTFGSRVLSKEDQEVKISVIGLGYMGLPTACLLANAGYQVSGYDISQKRVDQINQGLSPFEESGLEQLIQTAVSSKRLQATTELLASDIFIIAVGTPSKDKKCDLSFVKSACLAVSQVAKNGNLIILESTVKPGTCEHEILPIFTEKNLDVLISHCPERAIPGNTLYEMVYNDRVVGGLTELATQKTAKLYKNFVKGEIFTTTATAAETVKLMENTFRDINIALANEFDLVAKELGVNAFEVIELANKHPRVNILQPGPGVGGHCIAVDPWFLVESSKKARLIPLAREINDARPEIIAQEALDLLAKSKGDKVGILGVAYKKNVDDCRETPALPLWNYLEQNKIKLKAFDPVAKNWVYPLEESFESIHDWADLLIIVTDHDDIKKYSYTKPVLDTRNCLL